MKHVACWPCFALLLAACLLSACQMTSAHPAQAAVLTDPDEAVRQELRQAIQAISGFARVTPANSDLTRSSELVIERKQHHTVNGDLLQGRDLEQPQRFALQLQDGQCCLLHRASACSRHVVERLPARRRQAIGQGKSVRNRIKMPASVWGARQSPRYSNHQGPRIAIGAHFLQCIPVHPFIRELPSPLHACALPRCWPGLNHRGSVRVRTAMAWPSVCSIPPPCKCLPPKAWCGWAALTTASSTPFSGASMVYGHGWRSSRVRQWCMRRPHTSCSLNTTARYFVARSMH